MSSNNPCIHCKTNIEDPAAPAGFCCTGCAAVHALIRDNGLERFYDLQRESAGPVCLPQRADDLAWLEPLLTKARAGARKDLVSLDLDLQGLRCAACVWLLSELFKRQPGGVEAVINPALGRVTLNFAPDTNVAAYLREVEQLGYRAGPVGKAQDERADGLLMRLGVCVALTLNSMMFTLANYMGMTPADGAAFSIMRVLNVVLTVAVVVLGGGEFFRRAWAGVRAGHVGFDVPVALGIALSFTGSVWMTATDLTTFGYLDTVNTFTTLMLVGRWLQERVLLQNRRQLLQSQGLDVLSTRRVTETGVEVVAAATLRRSDTVLLPMGSMLPVDGVVDGERARFSLDWVNGEPEPRAFDRAEEVPAGSFNAGSTPVRVVLTRDFADSSLLPLLMRPLVPDDNSPGPALLNRMARYYSPVVIGVAALGAAVWMQVDASRALEVATSVLVVTCPCFIGLAIPLTWQRTAAQLRARGIFVRRTRVLDNALRISRVVFDKTGTLTLGQLRVAQPRVLDALPQAHKDLLLTLTGQSAHPRSACLNAALQKRGARWMPDLTVEEVAGRGMQATWDGAVWRVGSAAFALASGAEGIPSDVVVFSRDGAPVAQVPVEEEARRDAARELRALQAQGLRVAVLSGDAPERVTRMVAQLGLVDAEAVGGMTPAGKAEWLTQRGAQEDTLFVGDGVNDHAAFAAALSCGTPAVDSGVLAASADFYFLTPGIRAVRDVLETGRRLQALTTRLRNVALSYNSMVVLACLLGLVSPLAAAVTMPLSSLAFLLWATRATSPRVEKDSHSNVTTTADVATRHAAELGT